MAACALKSGSFLKEVGLSALWGDERVAYEADRVLLIQRNGLIKKCGCVGLDVHTLKNRTGPAHTWQLTFWGARFYPALNQEEVHP
jgi:hypothetical protein